MAIKNKEEMLSLVRGVLGDRTDDETLNLLEDLSDTLDERFKGEESDWKKKYEDNDAEWRQRYRDRFFNPGGADTNETLLVTEETELDVPDEPLTFDRLFEGDDT